MVVILSNDWFCPILISHIQAETPSQCTNLSKFRCHAPNKGMYISAVLKEPTVQIRALAIMHTKSKVNDGARLLAALPGC